MKFKLFKYTDLFKQELSFADRPLNIEIYCQGQKSTIKNIRIRHSVIKSDEMTVNDKLLFSVPSRSSHIEVWITDFHSNEVYVR